MLLFLLGAFKGFHQLAMVEETGIMQNAALIDRRNEDGSLTLHSIGHGKIQRRFEYCPVEGGKNRGL